MLGSNEWISKGSYDNSIRWPPKQCHIEPICYINCEKKTELININKCKSVIHGICVSSITIGLPNMKRRLIDNNLD